MNCQAIIFDLDGTLLDTLKDLAKAVNSALAIESLSPCPTEQYKKLVGSGARNLMKKAAAFSRGVDPNQIPADQIDRLMASFNKLYDRSWAVETKPYPGVVELLEQLRKTNLKLAILSNKPDAFTKQITNHYFPTREFSPVYGKLDDYPIKPDPTLALKILEQMDIAPSRAMFVGDSGSDMQTARNAGMTAVGVLWGFRDADELKREGADHLIGHPSDLLALLD